MNNETCRLHNKKQQTERHNRIRMVEDMLPCSVEDMCKATGYTRNCIFEYLKAIKAARLSRSRQMSLQYHIEQGWKVIKGSDPHKFFYREMSHVLCVDNDVATKVLRAIREQYDKGIDEARKGVVSQPKPKQERLFKTKGNRLFTRMENGEFMEVVKSR